LPLVQPGDDLGALLVAALRAGGVTPRADDVLVVAQKVVSKAENQFVALRDVVPSGRAQAVAETTLKDPRLVEVILWDTAQIIRAVPHVLIVQHRLGFISANAGIDHSNVAPPEEEQVLRLPTDPDASARRLQADMAAAFAAAPAVLIIDSHGRPWRQGTVGVAIGVAGMVPLQDLRGTPDLFGVPLQATDVGFADQIAAAASLLMGQAAEGCPAVLLRGLPYERTDSAAAADVLRPPERDLFR
jgi:coenzyme F420-0:L-glutamate ligase/coenzyme F420-1:gamma-L-glutamate ligase